MEAKAKSPANMAKALLPTVILLFAADNGHAAPAAKVAEPKMAAAPRTPPSTRGESTENRLHHCPLLQQGEFNSQCEDRCRSGIFAENVVGQLRPSGTAVDGDDGSPCCGRRAHSNKPANVGSTLMYFFPTSGPRLPPHCFAPQGLLLRREFLAAADLQKKRPGNKQDELAPERARAEHADILRPGRNGDTSARAHIHEGVGNDAHR